VCSSLSSISIESMRVSISGSSEARVVVKTTGPCRDDGATAFEVAKLLKLD
jgi:hypothetical protein